MTEPLRASVSLRRRLVLQLLLVAAILSLLLYLTVRTFAQQTAQETQDNVLGASATSIAEEVRAENGEVLVDIPYAALAMLGTISEDRVFYRIVADGTTLTGYGDLPLPEAAPRPGALGFETLDYRGEPVRIARMTRRISVETRPVDVDVLVAQTRNRQEEISANISNSAAVLGVGFFLLAGGLSWAAAQSALRPLNRLAGSVRRRGPHDLRPVRSEAPKELLPLLVALNSFMDRLRGALRRTEDFIAEAAHRVRTPLATVRAKAEIALRQSESEPQRQALRDVIRAVDESSRSAGQLLDHAMVTFRSDQMAREPVDLEALVRKVIRGLAPTADMRDIEMRFEAPPGTVTVEGDPILLQGALRNLLDNAIKYSPADSAISLRMVVSPAEAGVEIRDRGRGFGDVPLDALRRRFGRGANVADVVGSGLGLTIAEEVAAAHGGRLDLAHNEEGQGACVSLILPRA